MHALKSATRALPRAIQVAKQPAYRISKIHTPASMSLFPRFVSNDFAPLFRLLDDYDYHRATTPATQSLRAFQPKFDVKETKNAYELHGELPGIDQKDISIEFSEPLTLIIKGCVERVFEQGENGQDQGCITGEAHDENQHHKQAATDDSTQVTKSDSKQVSMHKNGDEGARYWISERSIGEFYRTFSFPARVDQDNVKASLKDGILSIIVPKATARQSKKVEISSE